MQFVLAFQFVIFWKARHIAQKNVGLGACGQFSRSMAIWLFFSCMSWIFIDHSTLNQPAITSEGIVLGLIIRIISNHSRLFGIQLNDIMYEIYV